MRKTALTLIVFCATCRPANSPSHQMQAISTTTSAEPVTTAVMCTKPVVVAGQTPSSTAYALNPARETALEQAANAILKNPNPAKPTAPSADAFSHPLKYKQLVEDYFRLTADEKKALDSRHFFVRSNAPVGGYAYAYHDIYQAELPMFVSADSILNAVFVNNDLMIENLENRMIIPRLSAMLEQLSCQLDANPKRYPATISGDLRTYLDVARRLLADDGAPPAPSNNNADAGAPKPIGSPAVDILFNRIVKASGIDTATLFGRDRRIDFSMYQPRGHYADTPDLSRYFRAAMWLSRLEFNIVSRSSRSSEAGETANPAETPHEAFVGLALADLIAQSGELEDLHVLEKMWDKLAGGREDISASQLLELAKNAGIGDFDEAKFDKLKAAVGGRFRRTAAFHPMPEGTTELPAIFTMLGPRMVSDSGVFRFVTHDKVPLRYNAEPSDIAYAMGFDHAKNLLKRDLAKFPQLDSALDDARRRLKTRDSAKLADSNKPLYEHWFSAVESLAHPPMPFAFESTHAFADFRIGTLVTGYGQLRHNYVLIAGQEYSIGGCVIPDAIVEPEPEMFHRLVKYADSSIELLNALSLPEPEAPKGDSSDRGGDQSGMPIYATFNERDQLTKMKRTLQVLERIASDVKDGKALTADEKTFLSMVVEMEPSSTGGPARYSGWYFQLFPTYGDGLKDASFIADYQTGTESQLVSYIGAHAPQMAFFAVERPDGDAALYVGPVANGFQSHGSIQKRYTDQDMGDPKEQSSPWQNSYVVKYPDAPNLSFSVDSDGKNATLVATNLASIPLTIELLDHHRKKLQTINKTASKNTQKFKINASFESIRLVVGQWSGMVPYEPVSGDWGYYRSPD